jgi:diaminopimelate decarboxylase
LFTYTDNTLYCESVALADIARKVGTPCYVYSTRCILEAWRAYDTAFRDLPHSICYAVKANSSLAILALLAGEGSGFDIVSAGELYRVLEAGGNPSKVVFSGVGKTAEEVAYALDCGIHSFNCESESELALIDSIAGRSGKKAQFSLRVNPDVDARTHPYIATGLRDHKFGIDIDLAEPVYYRSPGFPNLVAEGVSCHIGSQLLDTAPMLAAAEKVLALALRLRDRGLPIRHVDLGGGLGVAYQRMEIAPEIGAFIGAMHDRLASSGFTVMIEPGRSIVGPAGVLLSRVLYRKQSPQKEFVVVDAAMNDLIRPSLYQAHHEILPLRQTTLPAITADVVGPVCETGDFLARNRKLANVLPGDFVAVMTAGAYGFVLSSNYNSRTRAPEVLVNRDQWRVIRQRESLADLVRGESL